MRQVLPSLLKTLHRGQKSSICESGKGDEGGRPSEASCLPRSVVSKSSFPKLTHHISQLSQLTTMWVGSCAPSRFAPALSRCPPSRLHLAPPMLFLLRRNRVLRPASAWDRGRVIHLILSPQFGYGIPPCEYEVATFVEMEPQPSFMDFPAHPCNNQEAESNRGDKAKGDSIVV